MRANDQAVAEPLLKQCEGNDHRTTIRKRSTSDSIYPRRLYVSRIPFRFRERDLRTMFKHYGTVEDAEVIFNRRGSKGYGFVTMVNKVDAEKARRELDGKFLNGRRIEVDYANMRINVAKKSKVGGAFEKKHSPMVVNRQNGTNLSTLLQRTVALIAQLKDHSGQSNSAPNMANLSMQNQWANTFTQMNTSFGRINAPLIPITPIQYFRFLPSPNYQLPLSFSNQTFFHWPFSQAAAQNTALFELLASRNSLINSAQLSWANSDEQYSKSVLTGASPSFISRAPGTYNRFHPYCKP